MRQREWFNIAVVWITQGQPDDFVPCPESLGEIERASLTFQVNFVTSQRKKRM